MNSNSVNVSTGNYRWVILALLTLAQLVMSMGAYSWGPLAPFLRAEFDATRAQIGAIVSVLYFASVVIAIPSGVAVDKWGSRLMLVIALASMGVAFAAMATIKVFVAFWVMAAIAGIGYGMINQISTKGLMLWFDSGGRATAMGIKQTGVTFGGALGAVVLPAISGKFGWRWAVVLTGVLMLAVALSVVLGYRDSPQRVSSPAVGASGPGTKGPDWRSILSGPGSKSDLLILSVVAMLLAFSQTSITSFLVLFLEEDLGFSMRAAGACLTVLMLAGATGRIAWGLISDRFFGGNRKIPMIILCFLAFACGLGLAFLSGDSAVSLVYCLSAMVGFTFMGWNALFITLGAEIAGPELAGSVTGFTLAVCWAGIIIGPPLFGAVADNFGYFWDWIILSVFALVGAGAFIYSAMRSPTVTPTGETARLCK
ncbi:MFS transporter [Desulfallas sp. Bu1-1]|uniref:MFS transporter n=1 Tax=Desulfallas sp. Bu1-1 TaxID=2787620 RepID=UPI00189DCC5B|nr:MFS transporter [Desulfallas sp. Bu1-1]MBF7084522.1 MFS transporter [Desulfallas sp. Bu1-1]